MQRADGRPLAPPPGTLRALLTILKGACYVVCRPCERYAPLSAEREDLDRPYEPCPFLCGRCGARAEIVMDAPTGFTLTTPAPSERKRQSIRTNPPAKLGPWHTPSFCRRAVLLRRGLARVGG